MISASGTWRQDLEVVVLGSGLRVAVTLARVEVDDVGAAGLGLGQDRTVGSLDPARNATRPVASEILFHRNPSS